MPGKQFRGKTRLAKVMIKRVGTPIEVYRPDGNAAENKYGKIGDNDVSYSLVGSEIAYRIYRYKGDRPNERSATGGTVDTDSPFIAVAKDADVRENDRVTFLDNNGNRTYKLNEQVPYDTHNEYRSVLITDG